MHIQNNDITPATPKIYIYICHILSLINLLFYFLIISHGVQTIRFPINNSQSFSIETLIIPCSYCALSVPIEDFRVLFRSKKYNLLFLSCPFVLLTSCTRTKSNLYHANFLPTALNEPAQFSLLTFQMSNGKSLYVAFLVHKDQSNPKKYVNVFL